MIKCDPDKNLSLVAGMMHEKAVKEAEKLLNSICDKYNYDSSYFLFEIKLDFFKLDFEFNKWKKVSITGVTEVNDLSERKND